MRQTNSLLIGDGIIRAVPSREDAKARPSESAEVNVAAGIGAGTAAPVPAFEVAPPEAAPRISPAHLLEQIVHAVRVETRNGRSEMVLRLNPPDLGHVHIRLVSEGGTVSAEFHAESEGVRAALQSHLPQLRTALSDAGIPVQQFTVSAGFGGSTFNGSGQGGASAYPEPATPGGRSDSIPPPSLPLSPTPITTSVSAGALDYLA